MGKAKSLSSVKSDLTLIVFVIEKILEIFIAKTKIRKYTLLMVFSPISY